MSLTRRGTLAALSFLALGACASAPTPPDTTIYLVRHAEKQAGDNPDLTVVGRARADILSRELQDAGLTEVWSTDTIRTIETAKPTATRAGHYAIYDAADTSPGSATVGRCEKNLGFHGFLFGLLYT